MNAAGGGFIPAALFAAGWSVRAGDGRICLEKQVDDNRRDPSWNTATIRADGSAFIRCAAGHPLSLDELEAIASLARQFAEVGQ